MSKIYNKLTSGQEVILRNKLLGIVVDPHWGPANMIALKVNGENKICYQDGGYNRFGTHPYDIIKVK